MAASDANESEIQLITGGAGSLIRTWTVTETISGVPTAVQQEVVGLSDEFGNPLQLTALLYQLVDAQNRANNLLYAILKTLGNLGSGYVDPSETQDDALSAPTQ